MTPSPGRLSCSLLTVALVALTVGRADAGPRTVVFQGEQSEHRWALAELGAELPTDWSPYEYLVLELRHSSPQRFFLFVYDQGGPRRVVIQPFGRGVWTRAVVPLKYFERRDFGRNMASVNNSQSAGPRFKSGRRLRSRRARQR